MRALRLARFALMPSVALWGGSILLAMIGAPWPGLFGLGLFGVIGMVAAALACVILQAWLFLKRRRARS